MRRAGAASRLGRADAQRALESSTRARVLDARADAAARARASETEAARAIDASRAIDTSRATDGRGIDGGRNGRGRAGRGVISIEFARDWRAFDACAEAEGDVR